jgi:hypothetical protein
VKQIWEHRIAELGEDLLLLAGLRAMLHKSFEGVGKWVWESLCKPDKVAAGTKTIQATGSKQICALTAALTR